MENFGKKIEKKKFPEVCLVVQKERKINTRTQIFSLGPQNFFLSKMERKL